MEENEVANTVNARDYKGFCNEEMTGVAQVVDVYDEYNKRWIGRGGQGL